MGGAGHAVGGQLCLAGVSEGCSVSDSQESVDCETQGVPVSMELGSVADPASESVGYPALHRITIMLRFGRN